VNDASGKAVGFLSQLDVLSFFFKNKDKLGLWVSKATIKDVRATKPIKTLSKDDVALLAFRELLIDEIGAAPVVDDKGKVVATLSLSDLAGIDRHNMGLLLKTVPEFLSAVHGKIYPTVGTEEKEALLSVIEKVVTRKIHQVWLLDDDKPTAAISLTNLILSVFLQPDFAPSYYSQHSAFSHYFKQYSQIKSEHKDIWNVALSTLLAGRKDTLHTIESTQTQALALETMAKNKVLSLPMSEKGKIVGIVSAFDILTVLAFNPKFAAGAKLDEKALSERLPGLDEPVQNVIGATSDSAFFPIFEEKDPITNLLFSLSQGVHRVLVNTAEGKQALLSQSDLCTYILQNVHHLGPIADAKISEVTNVKKKLLLLI